MNVRVPGPVLAGVVHLALLVAPPGAAADGGPTPEQVVAGFYAAYLQGGKSGLPSPDEMRRLSAFLSPGLARLIEDARRRQQEEIERFPQDKPPWIEGDLFSSLFEGPTGFRVVNAAAQGDRFRVTVHFDYADPADPGSRIAWDDAVLVAPDDHRWVIDDVYYLANWEFKPGVDLRSVLQDRGD